MKNKIIALLAGLLLIAAVPLHAQQFAIDFPAVYSQTIPAAKSVGGFEYYDVQGDLFMVPAVPLAPNLFLVSAPSQTAANNNGGIMTTRQLVPADIPLYVNGATPAQSPAATTRTYITGTAIPINGTVTIGGVTSTSTLNGIVVGSVLRWHFNMTKTAAGSATSTIDIAFGTTGTTADTAIVSFTKPAGTAAGDEAFVDIEAVVKTIGTSAVVIGEFRMIHNLAATGHAQIPCVVVSTTSGSFNISTATYVGVCITTGASDAITISQVSGELLP